MKDTEKLIVKHMRDCADQIESGDLCVTFFVLKRNAIDMSDGESNKAMALDAGYKVEFCAPGDEQ